MRRTDLGLDVASAHVKKWSIVPVSIVIAAPALQAAMQGHVTARHPGNRVSDDVTACGAASAAAAAAAGMQCTVAYCCSALLYGQLNWWSNRVTRSATDWKSSCTFCNCQFRLASLCRGTTSQLIFANLSSHIFFHGLSHGQCFCCQNVTDVCIYIYLVYSTASNFS